jgi:hypothetical protein
MQRLQPHTHPLAGLGLTLPEHIIFMLRHIEMQQIKQCACQLFYSKEVIYESAHPENYSGY